MNLTGAELLAADAAVAVGRVSRGEPFREGEAQLLRSIASAFRDFQKVVEGGSPRETSAAQATGESGLAPSYNSLAHAALRVGAEQSRESASQKFSDLADQIDRVLSTAEIQQTQVDAVMIQSFFRDMSSGINGVLTRSGEEVSGFEHHLPN